MSDIDINRVLQNIGELQDQNAIDFQQWKRLGQEIERLEGTIKTSDKTLNLLMKRIKADYESLKNQIINDTKNIKNDYDNFKNDIAGDVKNIKDDYENLRKVIIDENVQVELNNKINDNKNEIDTKVSINSFNEQVEQIANLQGNLISNKGTLDSLFSVNNCKAKIEDTDNTVFIEKWNDLSNWKIDGSVQVSNNKLYSTGTGKGHSGAIKYIGLKDNENLRITAVVNVTSGGTSGGVIVGVSEELESAIYPTMNAGLSYGIYLKTNSDKIRYINKGSEGVCQENSPLSATSYFVQVIVDERYITLSAVSEDGTSEATNRILRSGFKINNIYLFNSDTQALNGMSIGRVSVRKELQTIKNVSELKTVNWTGDSNGSWRVYTPKTYDSRIPCNAIICFHGHSSNEVMWSTNENMSILQRALVNAGYIVLTCSAINTTTWGADVSLDEYYNAYKYLINNYSIRNVGFYANSMGSIESLITLSQNRIPCSVWVGTVPTFDLKNNYDNGFKSAIDKAYNITATNTYEIATKSHNPALMSPFAFRCIPMYILSANADTTVSKSYNSDKLIEKVSGYALEVKETVMVGGHSTSWSPYLQNIIDFYNKYMQ